MDREVIQVASRYVGRIIGSRGTNIRNIQDSSQANIQVAREDESDGYRSIEISGTREQIGKAKSLIEDCQNDDRSGGFGGRGQRGGRRDDQWGGGGGGSQRDSWRDRTDNDQWGRRDRNDGWGGRSNGHRRDERNDSESNGDSWGGRRNEGRDRFGGRSRGFDGGESDYRGGGRSRGFDGGESDSRGGRRNDWRDRDSRGPRDEPSGPKEEIYILSFEVGKVIGQGGSKIRALQEDSNCKIKVARDGCNGVNLVEIFGYPEQTEKAKSLIGEIVDIVDRNGVNQGEV